MRPDWPGNSNPGLPAVTAVMVTFGILMDFKLSQDCCAEAGSDKKTKAARKTANTIGLARCLIGTSPQRIFDLAIDCCLKMRGIIHQHRIHRYLVILSPHFSVGDSITRHRCFDVNADCMCSYNVFMKNIGGASTDAHQPRFAFIIISYNTAALTRAGLASIRQFAAGIPHEVIVADNGSTDGSAFTLQQEFPEAQVLALGQNFGFAGAANRAVSLATAPWLIMFNSDAELLADTMAKLEDLLARHPKIRILGGQLLNPNGSLQRSVWTKRSSWRFEDKHQNIELMEVEGIIGAFMVIHHELWQRLGGMDEDFFLYYEETDFFWRARKGGAAVHWSPHIRVLHHRGGSTDRVNLRSKVEFCRSQDRFNRKYLPPLRYWCFRTAKVASITFNAAGNFLLCGLTLGLLKKTRNRLRWYAHLLHWRLRGSPAAWGLHNGDSKRDGPR
jgi:N-acetylglucosaminyl-diphospho-decaprenol L-rhamnosyltransferase